MKFEGTLASVCDYLEISQVFNERVREFLPRIVVTGIECDSRRVTKGTIYYAKKGAHYNPFDHIEEIKQKGAVAILIDAPEDQVSGFPLETIDADKAAAGEALKSSNYEPNTETKDTLSRLKRSGYCVINKYQSNQDLAVSDYHATDDSEEARIIAEAKMLRIVLPRGKSLSGLAGFIYGNPSEKLRLIGVTGTNGKSTITNLIAQMLNKCGHKCAVFGTLGYGFVDNLQKSANTTMDAISLQRELASFVEQGADYAVLEVSSIGYCEGRVAGLSFYAGAFSNLSRDHLDYHETMEDYFCSKLNFLRTIPPARLVLNCKNDVGKRYAETISGAYQVNLGLDDVPKSLSHMLNIKRVSFKPSSLELLINTSEKKTSRTNLNLLGYFNAENYAVALGVLLSMGYDIKHLMRITPELKPITGRMECFSGADKPRLIVDYAHTPDGVEQALKAAQYHNQGEGRIFSIVGCGGDRDSGKRPLMAMKASVYSDYAIFTADNPRSEPLDLIIDDMMMAIDSNAAEGAVRKAEDLYDNLKLFVNDLIVTKKADKLGLLSPNQLSKVKSAIDGTLLTEVKNSFKLIEQFEQQENAIDGFSSEGVFLKAISVFEKAVAKLKEVFSFEEYDDIRIKSDKSIVNVEERADYYEAHKESFAIPAMLPPASRADRNVIIVHDRYQAIRFAFEHANKNDCVVIAGKGHEDYQIFPDKTIHFSDREICCELLGIKQDTKTNSNSDKPAKQSKKPVTKAKAKASSTKATAAKKPATKTAASKATAAKKVATTKAAASKATAAKKTTATKATTVKKPVTKASASKNSVKSAAKTAARKAAPSAKKSTSESSKQGLNMIAFAIHELLRLAQGELHIGTKAAQEGMDRNQVIEFVSTSSKDINNDKTLFVPLKGERFDAHDFIGDAISNGAKIIASSRSMDELKASLGDDASKLDEVMVLECKDTLRLLGLTGQIVRCKAKALVCAITGSCGKTTVKEMTASILSELGKTLYTEGNFNNDVGVPLTLRRLDDSYDFAVIEQGASHLGDIERTCEFVKAQYALITNVGEAHIMGFGSREGVYKGKSEILDSLFDRYRLPEQYEPYDAEAAAKAYVDGIKAARERTLHQKGSSSVEDVVSRAAAHANEFSNKGGFPTSTPPVMSMGHGHGMPHGHGGGHPPMGHPGGHPHMAGHGGGCPMGHGHGGGHPPMGHPTGHPHAGGHPHMGGHPMGHPGGHEGGCPVDHSKMAGHPHAGGHPHMGGHPMGQAGGHEGGCPVHGHKADMLPPGHPKIDLTKIMGAHGADDAGIAAAAAAAGCPFHSGKMGKSAYEAPKAPKAPKHSNKPCAQIEPYAEPGTAIVPSDSEWFASWKRDYEAYMKAGRLLSFGESDESDMQVSEIEASTNGLSFRLHSNDERFKIDEKITINALGRHNAINAAGAALLSMVMGAKASDVVAGLSNTQNMKGRLTPIEVNDSLTLIDDAYNASYNAVIAAVDTLSTFNGSKVLVFGDMGELGNAEVELHAAVGAHAKDKIDQLLCIGPLSQYSVKEMGRNALHFTDHDTLITFLKNYLKEKADQHEHTTCLVKGSHAMQMDKVVSALKDYTKLQYLSLCTQEALLYAGLLYEYRTQGKYNGKLTTRVLKLRAA